MLFNLMKFFIALFASLFLALPAWAVDVQMGSNGNLVFDPAEVTISAGESVHFVNNTGGMNVLGSTQHLVQQVLQLVGGEGLVLLQYTS